jgi:hypothetical protein
MIGETRPTKPKMHIRSHILAATAVTVASLTIPAALHAQAPAGPIHPLRADADTHAPAETEKKPLPRHELWGTWTLNAKRSDDTTAKLQKARGTHSAPAWGGFPRGRGPDRETPEDRDRADDIIYPQNSFALSHKDAEIDLIDDQARKRIYFTDGRKLQKSKDDKYKELAARWDAGRLVSEEKGPSTIKLTRSFEISGDGQHLYETLAVDLGAVSGFVLLRYVYDPAKPNAQDAALTKPTPGDAKP